MSPVLDEKDIMLSSHRAAILLIICDSIFKMPRKCHDSEHWTNEKNVQIKPQFCKTHSFFIRLVGYTKYFFQVRVEDNRNSQMRDQFAPRKQSSARN